MHEGFDPANGARPVRRLVQRYIEDPLSEKLLLCRYKDGEAFKVEFDGQEVVISGSVCDAAKAEQENELKI